MNIFIMELLDYVKEFLIEELEVIPFYWVSGVEKQSVDKATGEVEKYCKYVVEIPKGYGQMSRMRLDVKIEKESLKMNPDILEDRDVKVKFEGLKITYVDPRKGFYFKADDIEFILED